MSNALFQLMIEPVHIGDGAYITFDGYGFVLTANHHDPNKATDRIYMEPDVIKALEDYLAAHRGRVTQYKLESIVEGMSNE